MMWAISGRAVFGRVAGRTAWRLGQIRMSTSPVLLKRAKDRGVAETADSAVPTIDLKEIEEQMSKAVELFHEKAKEVKAGSSDLSKFTRLTVPRGNAGSAVLQSIATVASRGGKLVIVAFDPKDTKHIRSAIVGELNMPAEPSKTDKQTLSVTIPTDANRKNEISKGLKEAYEHFRNSSARQSVSSVRAKHLAPLKKAGQALSTSEKKKMMQQVEELAKKYNNKLQEALKRADNV